MKAFDRLLESLSEEITCCICLEVFKDPVSIQCGHNFCRVCLEEHWRSGRYQCPECRQIFKGRLMPTDFRLKSLVDKIKQSEMEKKPNLVRVGTLNGHREPLQLVAVDEDGRLEVFEEAIQKCLRREEMKSYPVCLISIAGEQCKGKTFLLNYLLRRLHRMEQDACIQVGIQKVLEWPAQASATGGMWIWSTPFLISQDDEKTAVFLVDMEESSVVVGKGDSRLKLAAFSALLGSYLIFSFPTSLRESDMESLEHLDILVQDCGFSTTYGLEGGQQFLRDMMKKLLMCSKYPRTLEVLKYKSRCCLLPSRVGNTQDIAEDLCKMYSSLNCALKYTKKDDDQNKLTLEQLERRIKIFIKILKMGYEFSSPSEMGIAIHNHKVREMFRKNYRDLLKEQDLQSRSFLKIVQLRSETLTNELYCQLLQLLEDSAFHLQGDESQKQHLLQEMLKEAEEEIGGVTNGYACKRRRTLLASVAGILGVAVAAPALSLTAIPFPVAAMVGGMASIVAGSSLGAIIRSQIFDKRKD
ncbi:RING finger protein 112 isoform X2 [Microcaecilia unicolor]|uniref:RING finger protein 112 isoform X2 n=1 Tax=Microcaecilia unicolor TaxID=1415580 RepID=A0A6P7YF24_9AMPH|nr:RING finger protein 112 isoform X2 [Microcaecilia unicolor]